MTVRVVLSRTSRWLSVFLLLVVQSGCQVRLVSDYDEKIDNGVTEFQRASEGYFIRVQKEIARDARGAPYGDYASFFEDETIALELLVVRAEATPLNAQTTAQLTNLQAQFSALGRLHRMHDAARSNEADAPNLLNPGVLDLTRHSFRTSIRAILKLEIAKRRGDSGANESK